MRNFKIKNIISVLIIAALIATAAVFAIGCGDKASEQAPDAEITVVFSDGDRNIASSVGKPGDPLVPPTSE